MTLSELVKRLGAQLLTDQDRAASVRLQRAVAARSMSELLSRSDDQTLLITESLSRPLLRISELLEVPVICLAGGKSPESGLVIEAQCAQKILLLSPYDLKETCRRVDNCGLNAWREPE